MAQSIFEFFLTIWLLNNDLRVNKYKDKIFNGIEKVRQKAQENYRRKMKLFPCSFVGKDVHILRGKTFPQL